MRIGFSSLIETASRWWRNGAEAVGRSMEHLSTGLRVSRAIDDAAGLAISEGLTARINGFDQGARNAQDGISLTQVAEGGLSEMHDTLQRMRTLAVSAANGTWSDADRGAMQAEFEQLMSGIDDVVHRTEFNGASVLDGSVASRSIQVGAEAGDVVHLDIARFDTVGLGLRDDPTTAAVTAFVSAASTNPVTTTATSTSPTTTTTQAAPITGNPNSPGYKKKAAAAAAAAAGTTTTAPTTTPPTTPTTTAPPRQEPRRLRRAPRRRRRARRVRGPSR